MDTISWWRIDFGESEINNIAKAIKSEHISQGPVTEKFEKQFSEMLDVPYAIATTSGSVAILMSLIASGIRPGDEVIVPNRTWIATAHAPVLLGAKVILVDVEPDLPIMDTSNIERKITAKTKAIIPVHLNGRSVQMNIINQIAKKYGLYVIEDAAQAFCSKNSKGFLGTQSFAGCFSLSVAKLISTGQGGVVITKGPKTYDKLKLIRTHGVRDIINAAYTNLGFNFRFTDIQASMGIAQLKRVSGRINKLKKIYSIYSTELKRFPFLKLLPVDLKAGEIPLYIEVLCPERDKLIEFLWGFKIQTRPFYPNLNSADYLGCDEKFPNSKLFERQGLFLPCGPGQPLENIERVIEILKLYKN